MSILISTVSLTRLMLFSSTLFLFIFLPIVLLGYYLLGKRFRNAFLLIASILFYGYGEPTFVFVMVGSSLINYFLGLWAASRLEKNDSNRLIIILTIILNIGLLFVYKYTNFTVHNLNILFDGIIPQTSILLPIGISFFTFQAMSYVFDVCAQRAPVQKNPFNVLLYVSLFPQLIAGPIVRYETVAYEIKHRRETLNDVVLGMQRFMIGLAKKVIIADTIAAPTDEIFNLVLSGGGDVSMGLAWLGALGYTLQIYFDFSGYSDMAIGLGLMFGFHFKENFNYPYISKSISEFWRRWHISMGTWFRDYVYYPLGGSRVGTKSHIVFNLFVVWLLTGIWHGANWTFIVWGLMYFVLIAAEKMTGYPDKWKTPLATTAYRLVTLFFVVLGWVIFRSENMQHAMDYLTLMFIPHDAAYYLDYFAPYWPFFLIALVGSAPIVPFVKNGLSSLLGNIPAKMIQLLCFIFVGVFALIFSIAGTYEAFIYFNF